MNSFVIIGCVDLPSLDVRAVKAERREGNIHVNLGVDGDYNFRVIDNVIYWWYQIPGDPKIRDAMNEKLDKMGVPSSRMHKVLMPETPTFASRFEECHGYSRFLY